MVAVVWPLPIWVLPHVISRCIFVRKTYCLVIITTQIWVLSSVSQQMAIWWLLSYHMPVRITLLWRYGFSPELLFCEIAFSHRLQWYYLCPLWAIICLIRLPLNVKTFSHWVHWFGFSPVWVIICMLRLFFIDFFLSHWSHWYGFCPVWVTICLSRIIFCGNYFSHCLYWYSFSPVWVIICLSRILLCENALSNCWH